MAVESCSLPAIETNRHLIISGLNQPALALFGHAAKEMVGQALFGRFLLPHDGKPSPKQEDGLGSRLMQAVLRSGIPSYFVVTHIPLDQAGRWIVVLFDVTGQFTQHRELAGQQSISMVVSSITNRLLDVSANDIHQNIVEISRTLSMFLAAEGCYVGRWRTDHSQGEILQGWWQDEDLELDSRMLNEILTGLPEFIGQLQKMNTVHQTADAPYIQPYFPERPGLKYLKRRGAKAVIASPLIQGERMLGFVVCERHTLAMGWPPDEVMMLRTVAEALSSTLARLDAEEQLRKQTQFMNLVSDTLQTGVMVSNVDTGLVFRLNRHAGELLGLTQKEIMGKPRSDFLVRVPDEKPDTGTAKDELDNTEWLLRPAQGRPLNVLRTARRAHDGEMDYLVECFSDITALKLLMENQTMDMDQARRILDLVEGERHRHVSLDGGQGLFISAYNLSCMDEGGDHYFIREIPPGERHPSGRVQISLKDQSGHQVGCMLRCILTDLLHQRLLARYGNESLAGVTQRLNSLLCNNRLVPGDDFFTGVFCQIDRRTRQMEFITCGHPRALLLRDGNLTFLPKAPGKPGANPPLGLLSGRNFSSGSLTLRSGDRIILYTDGLMEAAGCCSPLGRGFGTEHLAELVLGLAHENPGLRVEDLMNKLIGSFSKDGQSLLSPEGKNLSGDDVTLIGLEVEDITWEAMEVWHPTSLRNLQSLLDRYYETRRDEWRQKGFENPKRLKLCLEEAVANAYWHGNQGKEKVAITMRHRYGNDFHLRVTDNGPGFDWAQIPGLSHVPSPISESGRGIFLMRRHSNYLKWNQSGNELELALSRSETIDKKKRVSHELISLFTCDMD